MTAPAAAVPSRSPAADSPSVPKYKIVLLRVLYALMAVFLGQDAWTEMLTHQGAWEPAEAAAWSVWASCSVLALGGLVHPLRMLPIVLLEIVYKCLWLAVVALPLAWDGALAGSPVEEMTYDFLWVVLPIMATPWRYAAAHYVRAAPRPR